MTLLQQCAHRRSVRKIAAIVPLLTALAVSLFMVLSPGGLVSARATAALLIMGR